ncbi:Response regulator NasT [Cronobacter malonaticus 507]|nr:Response regulator NasT [Cronobacter malonaticus 507]
MESFNLAIRHLLDLVPEASESVDEASLARALTALYSFMQGKELAGQERATGAIGFTQGAFSEPLAAGGSYRRPAALFRDVFIACQRGYSRAFLPSRRSHARA